MKSQKKSLKTKATILATGKKSTIRYELSEIYGDDLLFMDGFDSAIIGICIRFGMEPVVAYDYDKVIKILMVDGCTYEEAVEYHEFNQIGAWVGGKTPAFVKLNERA
jgi:hypothetical protein